MSDHKALSMFQMPELRVPVNPLMSKERLNPAEWTYERLVR